MTPFDAPGKQAFSKHCGKRRNCLLRAISPFPTVFSTRFNNFLPFSSNLKLSSANAFSLEESKICRLVMGQPANNETSRARLCAICQLACMMHYEDTLNLTKQEILDTSKL